MQTIEGMLLRHLAATLLPLASTAAGVVAVGVAVQLPAAPPQRFTAPVVTTPVGPESPVVARVERVATPKHARRQPVVGQARVRSRAVAAPVRPRPATAPQETTTTPPEASIPVPSATPRPEEATPLTPPVEQPQPEPEPEPQPQPQPQPELQPSTSPSATPATTTPVTTPVRTTTAAPAVLVAAATSTDAKKTKKHGKPDGPDRPRKEKPEKTPRRPGQMVVGAGEGVRARTAAAGPG